MLYSEGGLESLAEDLGVGRSDGETAAIGQPDG